MVSEQHAPQLVALHVRIGCHRREIVGLLHEDGLVRHARCVDFSFMQKWKLTKREIKEKAAQRL